MSETELRRTLAAAPPDFEPLSPGPIRARADRRRRLAATATVGSAAALAAVAVLVPRLGTGPTASPPATSAPAAAGPGPTARPCPPSNPGGIVDYVPGVRLNGVFYVESNDLHGGARPAAGAPVGVVRCTLEKIQPGAGYRPADGDATHLPVGTVLYATRAVPASFRLVTADGRVFRSFGPERPRRGADVLPLRGLVVSVDLRGPADRSPGREPPLRRRITDPAQVRALVDGIAAAPVVGRRATTPTGQVAFRLVDGTVVAVDWSGPDRLLEGRIELPAAVLALLR